MSELRSLAVDVQNEGPIIDIPDSRHAQTRCEQLGVGTEGDVSRRPRQCLKPAAFLKGSRISKDNQTFLIAIGCSCRDVTPVRTEHPSGLEEGRAGGHAVAPPSEATRRPSGENEISALFFEPRSQATWGIVAGQSTTRLSYFGAKSNCARSWRNWTPRLMLNIRGAM